MAARSLEASALLAQPAPQPVQQLVQQLVQQPAQREAPSPARAQQPLQQPAQQLAQQPALSDHLGVSISSRPRQPPQSQGRGSTLRVPVGTAGPVVRQASAPAPQPQPQPQQLLVQQTQSSASCASQSQSQASSPSDSSDNALTTPRQQRSNSPLRNDGSGPSLTPPALTPPPPPLPPLPSNFTECLKNAALGREAEVHRHEKESAEKTAPQLHCPSCEARLRERGACEQERRLEELEHMEWTVLQELRRQLTDARAESAQLAAENAALGREAEVHRQEKERLQSALCKEQAVSSQLVKKLAACEVHEKSSGQDESGEPLGRGAGPEVLPRNEAPSSDRSLSPMSPLLRRRPASASTLRAARVSRTRSADLSVVVEASAGPRVLHALVSPGVPGAAQLDHLEDQGELGLASSTKETEAAALSVYEVLSSQTADDAQFSPGNEEGERC